MNDAEIRSVIYSTFKSLGFEDFTICINNRKILNGLFKSLDLEEKSGDILRVIDKIEKIGKENVIKELEDEGVEKAKIEKIISFIEIEGDTDGKIAELNKLGITEPVFVEGVSELEQVVKMIRTYKVPDKNFKVDLTIARGLDYYTGTVYETFLDNYKKLGSVCSGGRYENLAEYYTDKKLPGVGISIGLTRFFYQMKKENILKDEPKAISKILVATMSEENIEYAIGVAEAIRNAGINVETSLGDKKIKAKFKYADKLQIPYVAVIGEEEVNQNQISLKNMQTGEQETLSIDEVIEKIK